MRPPENNLVASYPDSKLVRNALQTLSRGTYEVNFLHVRARELVAASRSTEDGLRHTEQTAARRRPACGLGQLRQDILEIAMSECLVCG